MYLNYYTLKEKPFRISTNPKFLWLGKKHQEALATLKYAVLDNKGFLLLTGDVGTGKTTLINALVDSLGEEVVVATVPDPGLETLEFFNFVASAFKIKEDLDGKGAFLSHFSAFLYKAYAEDKIVVLIIDEAQRLSPELLEEIRHLSNIERQDTKLVNIFFVGQNELNDILLRKGNRAIRQRITNNYNIDPLTAEETGEYIRHRLKVAGCEKEIFRADAIREVFCFSRGYPRLINIICDHALLSGYVKELKTLPGNLIKECAEELRLPNQEECTCHTSPETVSPAAVEQIHGKTRGRTLFFWGLMALLLIITGYYLYSGGFAEYLQGRSQKDAVSVEKDAVPADRFSATSPNVPSGQALGPATQESPPSRGQQDVAKAVPEHKVDNIEIENSKSPSTADGVEKRLPKADPVQGRSEETPVTVPVVSLDKPEHLTNGLERNGVPTEKETSSIARKKVAPEAPQDRMPVKAAVSKSQKESLPASLPKKPIGEVLKAIASQKGGGEDELQSRVTKQDEESRPATRAGSRPIKSNDAYERSVTEPAPGELVGEPDPGDVIDWLLQERSKQ